MNGNQVADERRASRWRKAVSWYKTGYDIGRMVAGAPGYRAVLPALGMTDSEIKDWLDGLLDCLADQQATVAAVKTSIDIRPALNGAAEYDQNAGTYKGAKITFDPSLFPDNRVEVVIG
ncbi:MULTISPECIES: hypothetical protein [unclassified Sinorhizobium]|uniref:hypothetical protein n=1 Tax=unclassified Sinorhizobium TaxID=2613772 RepID=UPI0035238BE9